MNISCLLNWQDHWEFLCFVVLKIQKISRLTRGGVVGFLTYNLLLPFREGLTKTKIISNLRLYVIKATAHCPQNTSSCTQAHCTTWPMQTAHFTLCTLHTAHVIHCTLHSAHIIPCTLHTANLTPTQHSTNALPASYVEWPCHPPTISSPAPPPASSAYASLNLLNTFNCTQYNILLNCFIPKL